MKYLFEYYEWEFKTLPNQNICTVQKRFELRRLGGGQKNYLLIFFSFQQCPSTLRNRFCQRFVYEFDRFFIPLTETANRDVKNDRGRAPLI